MFDLLGVLTASGVAGPFCPVSEGEWHLCCLGLRIDTSPVKGILSSNYMEAIPMLVSIGTCILLSFFQVLS